MKKSTNYFLNFLKVATINEYYELIRRDVHNKDMKAAGDKFKKLSRSYKIEFMELLLNELIKCNIPEMRDNAERLLRMCISNIPHRKESI